MKTQKCPKTPDPCTRGAAVSGALRGLLPIIGDMNLHIFAMVNVYCILQMTLYQFTYNME